MSDSLRGQILALVEHAEALRALVAATKSARIDSARAAANIDEFSVWLAGLAERVK
ncbi:MAG: hypothetical protein KBE22_00110 [Candidatus Accumulibacter sp.]|nr:hypothetical protein [Accumulibacter sp.]